MKQALDVSVSCKSSGKVNVLYKQSIVFFLNVTELTSSLNVLPCLMVYLVV